MGAVDGAQLQGLVDLGTGDVHGRSADGGIVIAPNAQSADLLAGIIADALDLKVAEGVVVGLVGVPVILDAQLAVGFLDDVQQAVVFHGVIDLGGAFPREGDAGAQVGLGQHAGIGGAEDHGAVESALGEVGHDVAGLAQCARIIQLDGQAAVGGLFQRFLQVLGHVAFKGVQRIVALQAPGDFLSAGHGRAVRGAAIRTAAAAGGEQGQAHAKGEGCGKNFVEILLHG